MSYAPIPIESLIPPPAEINDTHKDYSIAITIIVLGIITSLLVFARLAQRFVSKAVGADDYAMIPSLVWHIRFCLAPISHHEIDLVYCVDSNGNIHEPQLWYRETYWRHNLRRVYTVFQGRLCRDLDVSTNVRGDSDLDPAFLSSTVLEGGSVLQVGHIHVNSASSGIRYRL